MLRAVAERLRPPLRAEVLAEEHPGAPRILFVGLGDSTHTRSWIDLLEDAPFNRLLFAVGATSPPGDWNVKAMVTDLRPNGGVPHHQLLHPSTHWLGPARRGSLRALGVTDQVEERWLADVIRRWRPTIVHTLGLDPAAARYLNARTRFGLAGIGTWIAQTRGGSDLELTHLDPGALPRLRAIFSTCDFLLSDNERNFQIATELGLDPVKITPLRTVPGTGGIDIQGLRALALKPPSKRRLILWPKGFESNWSKALPVFEALKLAWESISPCELRILAMNAESRAWFRTLPKEIRASAHAEDRIDRAAVLELMASARVMLAPSLIDGTPNTLFEAMAAGALPIVSPLDTITPIVAEPDNVLFARNLYPEEIASALTRAMSDDELVDAAAERNLQRVRELADRETIRRKLVDFYERSSAR